MFTIERILVGLLSLILLIGVIGLFTPGQKDWNPEFTELENKVQSLKTSYLSQTLSEIEDIRRDVNNILKEVADQPEIPDLNKLLREVLALGSRVQQVEAELIGLQGSLGQYEGVIDREMDSLRVLISQLLGQTFPTASTLIERNDYYQTTGYAYILPGKTRGQQFQVSQKCEVTSIKIFGRREGGYPSGIIFSLCETLGGLPAGNPLASVSLDCSSWSTTGGWHVISITGVNLQPNQPYVITITGPLSSTSSFISIGYHQPGSYPRGSWLDSSDGGTTWVVIPACDAGFEIYGNLN